MALTRDRTDVAKVLADTKKHVLVNWSAQGNISPLVITGAEGVWLHSGDRRILDFSSELVNSNLGHGHPRVVRAIQEQAARLLFVPQTYYNDQRAVFLEKLLATAPAGLERAFLANSGTEAIEAAIKFARGTTNLI